LPRLTSAAAVPAVRVARGAGNPEETWLVGGAVRDLLKGKPPEDVDDVDFATASEPEPLARRMAQAVDGHVFPLSEKFGAWRVIAPDRRWQADLTPLRGGGIEADLALRDFTINAMAWPLADGDVIDPHGGVADLDSALLRVAGERSFPDDPLRTMRMARFACELGLQVDPETRRLAAAHSQGIHSVSPERTFYELARLICSPAPLRGVELMDEAGLVRELLPELDALKGVEQNPYHHLDVWGHTLEVLEQVLALEDDLQAVFGEAAPQIAAELDRPLADGMTRGQALRLGALLHDAGKPVTRAVNDEGRILFWGHDSVGAKMSVDLVRRFKGSTALGSYLAALAQHHLVLGFMVREAPLPAGHVYRYLRVTEPVELEVTLLSVADRLATRGARTRQEAIDAHLAVARDLAAAAIRWRAAPPAPPVRGDELVSELGIDSGPEVGRLLELITEAVFAGEISSREEALRLAEDSVQRS
jgi:poly(A) polymerase